MAKHNYFSNAPARTPGSNADMDMTHLKWFIKSCLNRNMSVGYDNRVYLVPCGSGEFRILRENDASNSIDIKNSNTERATDLFISQCCLESSFDTDRYLFYRTSDLSGAGIDWRTIKKITKLRLLLTDEGPAALVLLAHDEHNIPLYQNERAGTTSAVDVFESITEPDASDPS